MPATVGAVVLTYNNYTDTAECLRSLERLQPPLACLIVVDNGSTDGSADRIATEFPMVALLRNGANRGVAGGFNPGIERALAYGVDYVCILNNDTVVEPDAITALLNEGVADPQAGILMPKILYYSDHTRIWSAGARYRRFPPAIVMRGLNENEGPRTNTACSIEYAPTCVLLISRRAFMQVGLLDDGYFFFFDDWDFSLRVRQAGLKLRYVPQARIYHKVSRTIQSKGRPPFYWRTWGSSAARFYRRFGRPGTLSAIWHLGYLALREGVRSGPVCAIYFVQGAVRSWRKPLLAPPHSGILFHAA